MTKSKKHSFSISSFAVCLALILLCVSGTALAAGRSVIPLGRTTGIKLFSGGAMVIGFPDDRTPARTAGLLPGDVITAVNGNTVETNEALSAALAALTKDEVTLTVRRNGAEMTVTVTGLLPAEWGYRLGAWVRDSMAGIGTITFVDPETGVFGALGHGVCDPDTGTLIPLENGAVMGSTVVGVIRGASGAPGQLTGEFDMTRDSGVLYANTERGVFGHLTDETVYEGAQIMETAPLDEVVPGPVELVVNAEGTDARRYDAMLVKTGASDGSGRDFILTVTDEALLKRTGGIVQGMSGSPILQNGRLIGAITHVLVDDPTRGYGIAIDRMLEAAEEYADAA